MTDTLVRTIPVIAVPIAPRRRRESGTGLRIGSHVFLMLLLIAFLAPVAWAVVSSFKQPNDIIRDPLGFDPSTFTLDNFTAMLQDVPIAHGFLNTGVVLVVKGGITLFFEPLAAYAFA